MALELRGGSIPILQTLFVNKLFFVLFIFVGILSPCFRMIIFTMFYNILQQLMRSLHARCSIHVTGAVWDRGNGS